MPMKVLFLHGFGQNSQVFRQSTGGFRKLIKKFKLEVVFVDAPHEINQPGFESGNLGWYFADKTDRHLEPGGVEESLDHLEKLIKENNPDGIVGFSQGASIFCMLCASRGEAPKCIKFAMLFGCPMLNRVKEKQETLREIQLPILFVSGVEDKVIDWQEGEQLSLIFKNATFFQHDGGHHVPGGGSFRTLYNDFLSSVIVSDNPKSNVEINE